MRGRELKAKLVLAGVKQYQICAKVGLNASLLNRILNDRIAVQPNVYQRIQEAIDDAVQEQGETQAGDREEVLDRLRPNE